MSAQCKEGVKPERKDVGRELKRWKGGQKREVMDSSIDAPISENIIEEKKWQN